MTYPNTLVFVDYPTDDLPAAQEFYREVFGWEVEDRIADLFARIVPGQHFLLEDGSPSPIGNLHMGIYNAANAVPRPPSAPQEPTSLNTNARGIRAWILVSEDDSFERILGAAERLGGRVLWTNHFWTEFGGANASFLDPWGNQLLLWQHLPGAETDDETHQVVGEFSVPEGWTFE